MKNDCVDTIEYKGYEIEIRTDEMAQDPRTEFDERGTMVCFHSRYNLGDKHDHSDPDAFMRSLAMEIDPTVERRIEYWENGLGWVNLYGNDSTNATKRSDEIVKKIIEQAIEQCVILPLHLYDHSGITMRTGAFSCPWDSGQVGWIYITPEKIKKEYGWKKLTSARRRQIQQYLEGEVETYDHYLTGSVYGYNITAGEDVENDCDDSCWGFFGYDHEKSGLLEYARNAIDCHVESKRKEAEEQRRLENEHYDLLCAQQIQAIAV